jgi:ATP-dependent Lon protease
MVATRSQKKVKSSKFDDNHPSSFYSDDDDSLDSEEYSEEVEEIGSTDEEKPIKKKIKISKNKNLNKKIKSIQIQFVSDKKKKIEDESETAVSDDSHVEENEEDDEEDISEDSDPEDEFLECLPNKILDDPESMKKIRKLVEIIEKKTPTVEKLLKLKMRKKHKAEIFEWIMIYENAMPLSEEKKMLRKHIYSMMEMYQKEYNDYRNHKKELKEFEKKYKDFNELYEIQYKILKLNTIISNKEAVYRKYMELLEKTEDINEDFYKLKNWIQCALDLPFDTIKEFPAFLDVSNYLAKVRQIFDQELYGMDKVKEQLLLFIHSKLINPNVKGSCLGLIGDPGVGKTSIARCLAKVMDFPFEQVTFGGINSADFIRGFDYTYVGSRPGEIVRCLTRMKYKNGIIFFDEYEKISQNKDITSCLLHITDFTQNNTFRDNYLNDLVLDLSNIWFIYSMNSLPEDDALKDRIFCIQVDGYKEADKIRILCDYLLPRHIKNFNLPTDCIKISDEVSKYIVQKVSPNDKGIRTLEKSLKDLLNKISFLMTNQEKIKCTFMLPSKYFPLTYPIDVTRDMIDILLKEYTGGDLRHLSMFA